MKSKPRLVLFLVLIAVVLLQLWMTLVTMPEFHVSDEVEFRRELDQIGALGADSQGLRLSHIEGRWNGQYGLKLAHVGIVTDGFVICVLGTLVGLQILANKKVNSQPPTSAIPPFLNRSGG